MQFSVYWSLCQESWTGVRGSYGCFLLYGSFFLTGFPLGLPHVFLLYRFFLRGPFFTGFSFRGAVFPSFSSIIVRDLERGTVGSGLGGRHCHKSMIFFSLFPGLTAITHRGFPPFCRYKRGKVWRRFPECLTLLLSSLPHPPVLTRPAGPRS